MRPQSINGKFRYSEALIKEIKDLFPDDDKMHKMADEGSYSLQIDYIPYKLLTFSEEDILNADSLEELQDIARLSKRKRDISHRCHNEGSLFTYGYITPFYRKNENEVKYEIIANTLRDEIKSIMDCMLKDVIIRIDKCYGYKKDG